MSWTLLLLSQHPSVAADLHDELVATLRGADPTVEQLARLPLLEAVIKESLRLIPPGPFTWRLAAQPMEVAGHVIPVGTEVLTSIYHTHHMPELYADPQRFDPHRWETLAPGAYEYLPFSAGSRMCLGAAFAMLEIKVVLAMLLQRFRLQFVPRVPIDRYGLITIGPRRGLPMQVCHADRQFGTGVGGVRGNVREMVDLPA
jgi:cytochrome P450